jgi:hypothetical protein
MTEIKICDIAQDFLQQKFVEQKLWEKKSSYLGISHHTQLFKIIVKLFASCKITSMGGRALAYHA